MCFGVVKIVETTLILGGAREPSEARPGRSGTRQKTEKNVKNPRCAKFQVGTRHEVFDEKTTVFFTVLAFFLYFVTVVKIVEATLILGGAREPSEACPGRSETLKK